MPHIPAELCLLGIIIPVSLGDTISNANGGVVLIASHHLQDAVVGIGNGIKTD